MSASRSAFEAGLGIELDAFQTAAFDALDAGASVLVAAPTGSGKTVVAEYGVHRALADGRKTFYTTPLKALSNQKYTDFVAEYGARARRAAHRRPLDQRRCADRRDDDRGPPKHDLRERAALAGLRYVVLDEVHYLQNRYRGAVWEEVIIHLPLEVDLICLSATVSNAEEVADWIQTVRGDIATVIEEHRPVELTNLYAVGERGSGHVDLLPTFVPGPGPELRPNPEAAAARRRVPRARRTGPPADPVGRPPTVRGRRGARRQRHAAGNRLHLQSGRLRRRGSPMPRRRPPPHHCRGAPGSAHHRG